MQHFKPGDAVFILPKFAHLYPGASAVVISVRRNPFRPMFNEYTLEFPDRSTAKLMEFQIIEDVPDCRTFVAALLFDTQHQMTAAQTRGLPSGRQIILQTPGFHVDMRVRTTKSRGSIMGQVLERDTKNHLKNIEVRFLREARPIKSIADRSEEIVEVKRHGRNKETLDKYCVRFADGETLEVWSIQLEPA